MHSLKHIRRLIAAALAIIMALSLSVSAFAVEYDTHIDPNCPVCNPGVTQDSKLNAISDALAAVLSFSDVSSTHTFHDAIIWCANQSIVGGYTDGTFKPANTVTRNNFVVMLSRAFYADTVAEYNTETYLKYGAFVPNSMALFVNGILRNTSFETIFKNSQEMNRGISRYDMAQLMTNIMTKQGFSANNSDKNAAINKITDYSSIPSQYRDAVANVYALGIITGYADGSFNGDGVMNRGQAAVVIYRMMQYTGNSGGNITNPDPETPVDPSTGEVVCACVTIHGKLCEICHTAQTGNTTPVEPEKPETPSTPAAGTLTNGKPITEANVTEILNQLKSRYPTPTSFVNGYAGLNSGRNPNANCINKIVKQYTGTTGKKCSTTLGCGGWAAFVADEIFGQTGVNWTKTTTSNIRPGDLVIYIDNAGYIEHVSIYVGPVDGYDASVRAYSTDANSGKNGYVISWGMSAMNNIDCYTAYPD